MKIKSRKLTSIWTFIVKGNKMQESRGRKRCTGPIESQTSHRADLREH